jgi:hypothetical protein
VVRIILWFLTATAIPVLPLKNISRKASLGRTGFDRLDFPVRAINGRTKNYGRTSDGIADIASSAASDGRADGIILRSFGQLGFSADDAASGPCPGRTSSPCSTSGGTGCRACGRSCTC